MKFLRMFYHPDPGPAYKNRQSLGCVALLCAVIALPSLNLYTYHSRRVAVTNGTAAECDTRCTGIVFSRFESTNTIGKTFPDKRKSSSTSCPYFLQYFSFSLY